jgi:hypothetical protein
MTPPYATEGSTVPGKQFIKVEPLHSDEQEDVFMSTPKFHGRDSVQSNSTVRVVTQTDEHFNLPPINPNFISYQGDCEDSYNQHSPTVSSTISLFTDPTSDYQHALFAMLEEVCTAAARRYWQRSAARTSIHDLGEVRSMHRHTNSQGHRHAPCPSPSSASFGAQLHRSPERSLGFMDYVSRITNLLWERARREELMPRRAELEAIETMFRLYRWAETVVKAWEGRDEEVLGLQEVASVVLAARDLCAWLGSETGRVRCENVISGWGIRGFSDGAE